MTIELFEKEIINIVDKSKTFNFPKIDLILHTPNDDIKVKYPQHLEIDENYNIGLFPEVFVDLMLPLGDYKEYILPYRDGLEISIIIDNEDKIEKYRYKFIILNIDQDTKTSRFGRFGNEELNKMDNVMIKGQCVDPLMLVLKDMYVSGSFLDTTHEKVIKYLFANKLKDVRIVGKPISFDMDMRELDNDLTYEHIVVNSYTKLVKLIYHLQNYGFGIYNGGANLFIRQLEPEKYRFYIYPLFNYELFEEVNEPKIMFFNSSRIGIDKNNLDFYKDVNIYKLITSEIKIENKGLMEMLKEGNTYIENNPTYVMTKDNIMISPSEFKIDPKDNNKVKGIDLNVIDRPFNNVLITKYDNNLFKYRGQILRNNILDGTLKLNMVNANFLRPGMLMKYLYVKSGSVIEKRGVIQYLSRIYNFTKKETATLFKFRIER